MHRYYVAVISGLLRHRPEYSIFAFRHPFPPYATHYAILLLLRQVFSYDVAEKVLVCLILALLACGLRFAGRRAGPSGVWNCLLVAPLLLGWPVMIGFFNYTLGIGLVLVALGLWQRLTGPGMWALPVFAFVLATLTFTHPVPLLILLCVCHLDLALGLALRGSPAPSVAQWFATRRWQFVGLALQYGAAVVPLRAVDATKVNTTADHLGLHIPFVRTSLLLSGLSPYNTRALSLTINFERLCLYAIFAACFVLGARAFRRALHTRTADFSTTMFIATCLLILVLPFLPEKVNGSFFFASRLLFPLWFAVMLAAAGAPAPARVQRILYVVASGVCLAATLLPAQGYIRRSAYQMRAIETAEVPPHSWGLLLEAPKMGSYARFAYQLSYDPFQWAGVLPLVRNNDVALDSPWMDQKITPLEPRPGSPLLLQDMIQTLSTPGADPLTPTHSLPRAEEARLVQESDFLVYTAWPQQIARKLSDELTPEEAAAYVCRPPAGLFLICVKRPGSLRAGIQSRHAVLAKK